MPIQPTYPREGDLFSTASLNAVLSSAETWVNDIPQKDVQREAFMEEHLPSFLERGQFPNGYTKVGPDCALPVDLGTWPGIYRSKLGPDAIQERDYQQFSTGGPNAPYGPYNVVAPTPAGWRVPAHDQDGNYDASFEAELMTNPIDMSRMKGLHVKAEAESLYSTSADEGVYYSSGTRIAIGWIDEVGTMRIILRSVRMNTVGVLGRAPLTTSTTILEADILGHTLMGVFLAVAGGAGQVHTTMPDIYTLPRIGNYHLTVMPLRSE